MTTMFVQLRHVVYLLVLLQCCVCVAYAESANGGGQDSPTGGSSEIGKVNQVIKKTVTEVYENMVNISGCLVVIHEGIRLSKENTSRAEVAAKNITAQYGQIKELMEKQEEWKPDEWIVGKEDGIEENIYAFGNGTISVIAIFETQESCRKRFGDLDGDKEKLADARRLFLEVHDKAPKRMELEEKIGMAEKALTELTNERDNVKKELESLVDLYEIMSKANSVVVDLVRRLGGVSTRLKSIEETWEKEIMREVKERIDNLERKLEEEIAKVKEAIRPRLREWTVEEEGKKDGGQPSKGAREKKGVEEEERKKGGDQTSKGVGETKRVEEEGKKDGIQPSKGAGETKRVEEEEGKKDGDQPSKGARETKGAEEEGQKTKEEKEKEEEAEKKENKDEEKKEDAPQQEGKGKEERKEEESKNPDMDAGLAIKAIQTADSSSRTALVRGPLMLILLCVLGSTLVC
ncbi:uncharacterized protein TM35_001251010 [Trypanosoma theileri]|uniref:Uncharacterized protein n=1 Tax=Trypanosoma theileri TaxID=67003 RepID=A0A1X0NE99_9TRYP|nr:uncharacterized protein TM35_001251010 [Trypanosoma theileri]ORC81206.1 hypothetical protein TM35_001251010 [Trypanosoma theileri]